MRAAQMQFFGAARLAACSRDRDQPACQCILSGMLHGDPIKGRDSLIECLHALDNH